MSLEGKALRELSAALRSAFPTPERLQQLLTYRLDRNLHDHAGGADLQAVVFHLLQSSEAEGWTLELVEAARESNPGNEKLADFTTQLGLTGNGQPEAPALERIIQESNGLLDVARWRARLSEIETRVCRIEIEVPDGSVRGTGFLVGPDVVMTNQHVVDSLIDGTSDATRVRLRFDYKRLEDGATLNSGVEYTLAGDWLIDASPKNELDYALLRLAEAAGTSPVGTKAEPDAAPRGWISVPETNGMSPGTPLFIVQHPAGEPIKLALDNVLTVNADRTRVRYRTNTEPGSSGSPCFDINWTLVALHHSGDPNFEPTHEPQYNEGIPLTAILSLLEKRGKRGAIGAARS